MLETLFGAAAAWLAADAFLFTPYEIEHRRLRMPVSNLPEWMRGLRLIQLSDLHVGEWTYKEIFIRQRVLAAKPDLLVLTGDLLSNERGIPAVLELLEGFSAPLGVYFVPGNNEIEEIELPSFLRRLEQLGIHVLVNQSAQIGQHFWIAGVDDPGLERDDLGRALRGVPESDFRLLLAHSPEIFYQAADRGVELTLSGHTHGGQVRLPFLGALYSDTQRTGLNFVMGEYRRGRSVLYVNRGVGMSLLPIRWLCPPELLELELVPADIRSA